METRKIGKLEVSVIGMGCMAFSHGYGKAPEREYSIGAIRAAVDAGCTFFDTAEGYGQQQFWLGHNEELVGEALAPVRDQVKIATKFHPAQDVIDDVSVGIRAHLEASLRRLGTDRVDLYYLHRFDERLSIEEVATTMGDLIDEGLIGGWGMSQVDTDIVARAHEVTPLAAVQNLYNILERDCEKTLLPYLVEQGIGLVPFSPVASGLLSGKIRPNTEFEKVDDVRNWVPQMSRKNIEANLPIIAVLERWAAEKEATPAQISLAWMVRRWPSVVPIPGSKNKERILENLGAADVALSAEEAAALTAELDELPVFGHRGHVEYQGRGFLNGPKNR